MGRLKMYYAICYDWPALLFLHRKTSWSEYTILRALYLCGKNMYNRFTYPVFGFCNKRFQHHLWAIKDNLSCIIQIHPIQTRTISPSIFSANVYCCRRVGVSVITFRSFHSKSVNLPRFWQICCKRSELFFSLFLDSTTFVSGQNWLIYVYTAHKVLHIMCWYGILVFKTRLFYCLTTRCRCVQR